MRAVVIGGGLGGMAAAARLAKLGHDVTLLEASPALGGALRPVEHEGFVWDGGPHATLLPAVVRDLFRKSGRPIERELELEPLEVVREHRFADGSLLSLPGGSRGAQLAAFDALEPGLGQAWVDYVASFADDWEVLRQHVFERPYEPGDRDVERRLGSRRSLASRVARASRDQRLRAVALHPFVADGHDPRRVPHWMGLVAYLEQRFGAWTIAGGFHRLAASLTERLATRRVDVRTGVRALDVVVRSRRAVAVSTSDGDVDADAVVVGVDPSRLPALARYALPAVTPPRVTHLGLSEPLGLPAELVLGDIVVRTRDTAITLLSRAGGDALALAQERDGRLRGANVVVRLDRTPDASAFGPRWNGRRTVGTRLGPATPIDGVYAVGAHATPGSGVPFVGLSAALVAQLLTP